MANKKKEEPVNEEVKKDDVENEAEENKQEKGDDESADMSDKAAEEEKTKSQDQETFESKYLRMTADFQNYKRRAEKEKSDIHAYANEKFAKDLLDVLDNFERAIEQDRNNEANEQFLKGMEMILKQFTDVLKKNNVEEIDALGAQFDPNYHHAVAMKACDEYDKDCVAEVMQKGYKLKDKVIRPSMVKVSE